jgi:ribonuclease BN (tRNA processing enzyme)
MRIKILGGHGGQSRGFATTSFLIDDRLLIDAGSVANVLTVEEQVRIDHILISHSHLDHIKDLAFLCDNCFGLRPGPFEVHTHPTVKKILMDHLFNDVIWPDFTILPNAANPTIRFNDLLPEKEVVIDGYKVTGVKVNHPNDAMGFIVEKDDTAVVLTVDTGATERIWEVAAKVKNLKGIITEVSFPNSLEKVAIASDHHTPQSLALEIKKMPPSVPIVLTHLKPNYREKIVSELTLLNEQRIRVLEQDGEVFEF